MNIENLASEVKEQNRPKKESRFYGVITANLMERAGITLLNLFQNKGRKVAKDFYFWLHEDTKEYLKQNELYRNCALVLERFKYTPSGFLDSSPDEVLDQIRNYFEVGKYEKARILADRFVGLDRSYAPLVCSVLFEPMKAVIRKNIRQARNICRIFDGWDFENWIAYLHIVPNSKLNKSKIR